MCEDNNTKSDDLYLIVSGIYRTGHHAAMQWITKNLSKNTIPLVERGITAHAAFSKNYDNINSGYDKNVYVMDIENFEYDNKKYITELNYYNNHLNMKVIVMRDPFNWLSSMCRLFDNLTEIYGMKDKDEFVDHFINIYKKNIHSENQFDFLINYNKLISDESYRIDMGKKMGLEDTCKNMIENVTKDGNGSSFDYKKYTNASNMSLLERYKLLDDKFMNILMNDEIITHYCKKNFGEIYKTIYKL